MGPSPAVADVRRAVRTCLADVLGEAPADGGGEGSPLLLAACSGGADSLALAAALVHEARRGGWRAGGLTVDHGLQPGSAEQAAQVARLLRGLGLHPVVVERVDARGPGGPEGAARSARLRAFSRVSGRCGAAAVLLGHTRDDQAESVLLGLARGSGARSLAGMAAVATVAGTRVLRPLLELPRSTTRQACADLGLPVWDDPHNTDPAYARVRVRARALPVLEQELGPGVAAALARTAALLREDADALDAWADEAMAAATGADGVDGGLDVRLLAALPAAVRRRVLRRAALAAGSPATDLTAGHVAELDRLVTAWHGQRPIALPGRVSGVRRYGRLVLVRQGAPGHEQGEDAPGGRQGHGAGPGEGPGQRAADPQPAG